MERDKVHVLRESRYSSKRVLQIWTLDRTQGSAWIGRTVVNVLQIRTRVVVKNTERVCAHGRGVNL